MCTFVNSRQEKIFGNSVCKEMHSKKSYVKQDAKILERNITNWASVE